MRHLGIAVVTVYRWTFGQVVGGRCKYHPSCSQYAIDALRAYGLWRGSVLAAWRLARCNPWSDGGVDHARDQRLFRRVARRRVALEFPPRAPFFMTVGEPSGSPTPPPLAHRPVVGL